MSYINYDDALAQLKSAGLIPDEPLELAQGSRSRRCRVDGEDREKRGWYRLYEWVTNSGERFLTGSYGVYRGDDPSTRKIELTKRCEADSCGHEMPLREKTCPRCGSKTFKKRELSREEVEALKARQAEDKKRAIAERNAEIHRAADWARAVWRVCTPAALDSHDYFARKQLKGTGDTRIFPGVDGIQLEGASKEDFKYLAQFAGALVVPMSDTSGRIFGLQFILSRERHAERIKQAGRDKDYWPAGLSKDEHYWVVGTPSRVLLLAEGYATAQSLHDATGHAVAVCFDAGNLPKVAKSLHKQYKRCVLLACGDDDWLQKCGKCKAFTPVEEETCRLCGQPHGKQNAGQLRAQEAALTADAAWMLPNFTTPRPEDKKGPTDFNDLACIEGLQVVRAQIEAKLAGMGITPIAPASPRSAGASPKGSGESRTRERPAAVAVMGLDSAVERFVPLDDGTGKYLFDYWTNRIVHRDQMIAVLPAGIRGDDVRRHPVWISRGAYYFDQVGFDPSGADKDVHLNTWQGWPMEPKEGCCERLLELIGYLCANEVDAEDKRIGPIVSQWLLRWMAYPLQNPGAKMSTAVIMHGPQGTGKSTVFQVLAKIYGKYATVLNQRGLEDKFNSDWVDCKLFLLAEEVVTRAEMWHIKNELKELVTGDTVRVNGKNVAAYPQKNQINMVLLSNEDQPLPLDNDDRRHLVVYTPPSLSPDFYDAVHCEIEQGGIEAFYWHLLHLDIGDFHPKKRPPLTQSKSALIGLSLPSEIRFINDWRAGDTEFPFCPCAGSHLYAAYLRWCRDNGVRMPRESNQFLSKAARQPGWESAPKWIYKDLDYLGRADKKQRMVIPDQVELIKHAENMAQASGEDKGKWLTRCFFKFQAALNDKGAF